MENEKTSKQIENESVNRINEIKRFRKRRNWAFCVRKCISCLAQLMMMAVFVCFSCRMVKLCFGFSGQCKCTVSDKWWMPVIGMVLCLAAMIILGIVISKCITAMSSNLKADTDANRKLNEKIDEKVIGKMG